MTEVGEFGEIVLVIAPGLTLALLSTKLTERVPIPGPAIFLVAAALASRPLLRPARDARDP